MRVTCYLQPVGGGPIRVIMCPYERVETTILQIEKSTGLPMQMLGVDPQKYGITVRSKFSHLRLGAGWLLERPELTSYLQDYLVPFLGSVSTPEGSAISEIF